MRAPLGIGEERLRACLQDQYDLIPVVLEFLPLGHNYNARVYHVRSGALWTQFGARAVILYPWINGKCSLTGMTNAQWQEVGSIFQRIHQVRLPALGFESLRKERFDPTEYAQWIGTLRNV